MEGLYHVMGPFCQGYMFCIRDMPYYACSNVVTRTCCSAANSTVPCASTVSRGNPSSL